MNNSLNGLGEANSSTSTGQYSLGNPNPSKGDFLVNLVWFISLCLSIMVALLASLAKQWCNSFISDRIAPPCNQARIRQARLNSLKTWRVGLIISSLPGIMHAALGKSLD